MRTTTCMHSGAWWHTQAAERARAAAEASAREREWQREREAEAERRRAAEAAARESTERAERERRCVGGVISMATDFGVRVVTLDSSSASGIAHRDGLGGRCRQIKVQYLWTQSKINDVDLMLQKYLRRTTWLTP